MAVVVVVAVVVLIALGGTYAAILLIQPESFEFEATMTRWLSIKLRVRRGRPPARRRPGG